MVLFQVITGFQDQSYLRTTTYELKGFQTYLRVAFMPNSQVTPLLEDWDDFLKAENIKIKKQNQKMIKELI